MILVIALFGTTCGRKAGAHSVEKRSFNDDFQLGNKNKDSEAEIMNMHLNANKYVNVTYREEYCKAKNWSVKFGW